MFKSKNNEVVSLEQEILRLIEDAKKTFQWKFDSVFLVSHYKSSDFKITCMYIEYEGKQIQILFKDN